MWMALRITFSCCYVQLPKKAMNGLRGTKHSSTFLPSKIIAEDTCVLMFPCCYNKFFFRWKIIYRYGYTYCIVYIPPDIFKQCRHRSFPLFIQESCYCCLILNCCFIMTNWCSFFMWKYLSTCLILIFRLLKKKERTKFQIYTPNRCVSTIYLPLESEIENCFLI